MASLAPRAAVVRLAANSAVSALFLPYGPIRFSFRAVELCGLWLKYNSNPIDYG
jgi:hypothetical protein